MREYRTIHVAGSCKQASKRAKHQNARDVSAVYPKSPVALSLLVPVNLLPRAFACLFVPAVCLVLQFVCRDNSHEKAPPESL